jgi:surfeit locus 1 family protein
MKGRRLRFLLAPRWIAFTLVAVVVAAVCIRLGFWQLDRLEGRRYFNQLFRSAMAAPAKPIETALAGPNGRPVDFSHVSAEGTYDEDDEVILYGRTLDDRPGNHVLTPLVLGDGRAVIVDRGWVPLEMDTPPVTSAAPPSGTVDVVGFLAPSEPGGSDDARGRAGSPATTFTTVDLTALQSQVPFELLPWYVKLQTQTPAQGGDGLPTPEPPPPLTDGPHLSYAWQWFSFAAIAVVGWVVLVRKEILDRRSAPPA